MINEETSRAVYQGDGQSTEFVVPFTFGANEAGVFGKKYQLAVYKCAAKKEGETIPASILLNEDTDYEVDGSRVRFFSAPKEGETVTVLRDVPLTQQVSYSEQRAIPVEGTGQALDKLTQIAQEHAELLARTLRVDPADTETPVRAEDYLNAIVSTANGAKESITQAKDEAVSAGEEAVEAAKNAADQAQEAAGQVQGAVSELTGYVLAAESAKTAAQAAAQNASEAAGAAQGAAEEAAQEALAQSKAYTDVKTGEVRELVNALQLVKFVSALPETGESKYLYAVPQDEKTLDGENIVLLFVWDEWNGWATVGVQTTAVDLSEYAKQTDLTAEASARQEADLALETATAAKYGPDNLTAGAGVKITELPKPGGIDAHTKAVWHFDGDTSMPIPQTPYFQGNLSGDTGVGMVSSQAKFGGKSLQLAGAGAYFGAVVRDWDLFAGDFTLEFWHYITGNLGVTLLGVSSSQTDFDVRNFPFRLSSGSLGSYSNNRLKINEIELNSEVEEPKNQWNHIALTFVKATSQVKLYLNGTFYGETTLSSVPSGACNLTFYEQSNLAQYFDEVRVSDVVRYDGDFTPRETAFYDDADAPTEYEISATAGGAGLPLLSVHWSDHLLNRMDMLRADTFSWQDGTVYTAAYQELLGEYNLVDKFYPFSFTGAATGEIQYFCKNLIPAVGDAVYKLGDDGVYIPAENTSTGAAILVTSVEMDTNYFGHETALIEITGYSGGTFIQGEFGGSGMVEDTAPRFSAGILETENGVSFVRTPKGYKIALPDQYDNVAALYESTGAAWYYILDVPNQRFKLPRTKFGFTGLRTGAGNYVAPGLPNITGDFNTGGVWTRYASGAFKVPTAEVGGDGPSGNGSNQTRYTFDASRSSSVYGSSQTVQPPATEMYLYFFVGNFTQSAVEQTAGLNAETVNELSGAKLDKSAIVRFETPYQQMAVKQAYTFDLTNSGLLNIPQEKWRVKFLLKMTAAIGSLAVDDVVEVVAASAWLSTYGASGLIFAKSGNNAKVVTGAHDVILWYPSSSSGAAFSNTQIKLCIEAVNA